MSRFLPAVSALVAIPTLLSIGASGCKSGHIGGDGGGGTGACESSGCADTYALADSVDVTRDTEGVVHVYAKSDADAFFASGYMQATDRLFQMELVRRNALGRSAEVFGPGSVGGDEIIRTLGIPRLGVENAEYARQRTPDDYALVVAWTSGVNRRIEEVHAGRAPRPLGFDELALEPERWAPSDAYTVGKAILFSNGNQLEFDLLATLIGKYVPETYAAVSFYTPLVDAFIVPSAHGAPADGSASPQFAPDRPSPSGSPLPSDAEHGLHDFVRKLREFRPGASNNWAVAGIHTDTGRSLLAGDPHQALRSPSLMWVHHMSSAAAGGSLDVVGWSFVGTPCVSLGHNANVAWTATTNYPDVTDLWDVEVVDGSVMIGPESVPIVSHQEEIAVRGAERVVVTIEEVPGHGVLLPADISPLPVGDVGRRLLFNWTGFRPTREASAFLGFDRAQNLDELEAAVDMMEIGSFNFVSASADRISYRSSPLVPDRGDPSSKAPAYLVLDGGDAGSYWTGAWLPPERLPHADGLDRGFIVTANNDPFGFSRDGSLSNDRFYFGAYFDPGTRAGRATTRLSELIDQGPVTIADMQDVQMDTYSMLADEIIPRTLQAWTASATDPDLADFAGRADLGALIPMLAVWDRRMTREQAAPLAFELLLFHYARLVVKDDLGVFYGPVLDSSPTYIVKIALLATRDPEQKLLQEGLNRLLLQALSDTAAVLQTRYGAVDAGYTWGDYHLTAFPSRSIPELDGGSRSTDGAEGTINVSEGSVFDGDGAVREQHISDSGAIYRMTATFDADGTPRAFFNMPGGNSGEPSSPFFDDRTSDWALGRYSLLRFKSEDVEAGRVETFRLEP